MHGVVDAEPMHPHRPLMTAKVNSNFLLGVTLKVTGRRAESRAALPFDAPALAATVGLIGADD
jgi:hypothetical protein